MTNTANFLPICCVQPVANVRQSWVSLMFHLPPQQAFSTLLPWLTGEQGFLAKVPSVTLLIPCADPFAINPSDLDQVPNGRIILLIPPACCDQANVEEHLRSLQVAGVRFMLDGCVPSHVQPPLPIAAMLLRCGHGELGKARETMRKLNGLHCAIEIENSSRLGDCRAASFSWFAGDFMLQPGATKDDGTSRARLLRLLALVERDADIRELETLLKQDMSLSFHLLKLVNSAAFAPATPITSFSQAINVLGRRQLQRWLQLLLYARPLEVGHANPLMPLAALRASLMEGLCAASGGDRATQDQAFIVGMFSLLHLVIGTALSDVISALKLEDVVAQALLKQTGPLGDLLKAVEQLTRQEVAPDLSHFHISAEEYWPAMIKAYHWATVVLQDS
ncbi:MAG: HDOD domain-containing protein [Burkholderiales bacterium]|nr:HDOD domain-containing protein [Burkholderiales bacterium]